MYLIRINVPGTLSTLVYTTLVFVFFVTYILNTHFFLSTKKTYYFLISLFSSISLLDGPWTSVSRELFFNILYHHHPPPRRLVSSYYEVVYYEQEGV